MGNPVGWFEIYVNDMPRAKAFYEQVLEVKLEPLDSPGIDMQAFPSEMNQYGAGGSLVHMPGFPAGNNSTLVYFSSPNCEQEEKRIEGAGGKVIKPKFSIGQYGFITLATDTEGNMFGIHSLA